MEADELVGERRRGVLIDNRARGDRGRGRGRRRGLLRGIERLVEVGPGGRMVAARVVQVIERVERVLHRGDRVDRDGRDRSEGRAAVGVVARRLGRLLPRVVFEVPVVGQQHLARVLHLVVVLVVVVGQTVVQVADHRLRTDLGPVVVLVVGHRVYRWPESGADDGWSFIGALRVLLHVLRQIGLLGVALAAVLTDVGLEVLRLLVLGYVLEQARLVRETLVAGVALVGLVGLVAARMALQIAQLTEGLRAAGVPTLVRLVACVRADVLLQVTQLRELPLADLAAVRLDAQVDASVLRQVRRVRERLRALRALVRLRLPHVDLRVQLQVRLAPEYL